MELDVWKKEMVYNYGQFLFYELYSIFISNIILTKWPFLTLSRRRGHIGKNSESYKKFSIFLNTAILLSFKILHV